VALLIPQGAFLQVSLSGKEELGALKKSFAIPLNQVLHIARVDDLWFHLRGIRAPGTGIPGLIMLGTTRYQGKKDFNAVYKRKPGHVVTLDGSEFTRLLITDCAGQIALEQVPLI
jgi:hypothetical protein